MNGNEKGFIMLTHPLSGGKLAVRADLVILVEEMGDGNTLVCLGEESLTCKESVEDVVSLIQKALCI